MSGESEEDDSYDWKWAHLLWQRRGIRLEEFSSMTRNVQLAYIASEQLAMKRPMNSSDRIAKGLLKPSK